MSKAEKRAIEKYPKKIELDGSRNVVFMSDSGSQYVSGVQDILKED